jgi:DNA-binding FrmR family transcriptional regulator
MYVPEGMKAEIQENILARLKKIEGQIRGLQAMVSDSRECDQILTQVRAVQSALKSVSKLVIRSYLLKCYHEISSKPSAEEMLARLDKVVAVLTKFVGS